MVATPSTMMPLGTKAPDFTLQDSISGRSLGLSDLQGERGTLIMFICNHCPYVLHIKHELIAIARHYVNLGVSSVAISANDIQQYPQDAPDKMNSLMTEWGNPFAAYLYDETQAVARAYQAACTPDFYVFDADGLCVYRGRLDGATPKNDVPVTGTDLRKALDCLLTGQSIDPEQKASIGCNIKWKSIEG
jgi:peroxiredoxin